MKIEHLALYVRDLEGAKAFFETYFEAQSNSLYHNPKTGFSSYFLSFADGARLEIMTKASVDQNQLPLERLCLIHLASSLASTERLHQLTQRMAPYA